MSHELINRSEDLKKLQNEGYEIEIKNVYALVHNIPYVNSNREIKYGTLVSNLTLAGNKTVKPNTHVIYFIGEHPCYKDGTEINGIKHTSRTQNLGSGIVVNHSFSNKPQNGYENYYDKFKRYIEIISSPAKSLDSSVTAKTFRVIKSNDDSVFNYDDTNSSRSEINHISEKMSKQKIGIIGLGGTGSYILDLVSKTPVAEIHIFDGDVFLQHNAFRTPGAPSIEKLEQKQKKTEYLKEIYSNMHRKIISHNEYLDDSTLEKIKDLDFLFISIDDGEIKEQIVNYCLENQITFIDLGIGVEIVDDALTGIIRATLVTEEKKEHIKKRISFANTKKDEYSTNIQIAELNALNATLAVIKWKKILGFYQDLGKEHNTFYTINTGELYNEDKA